MRKSASKPGKSLPCVTLCAGASALVQGSLRGANSRRGGSPPHAGVGEPLELGPTLRGDRRQPVGVARPADRVGDAPASGCAFFRRAPFGDAGALAGGEKGAAVRLRRQRPPGSQRRKEPDQDRLMHEIDRQAVAPCEAYPPRRRRLGSPAIRPLEPCQDPRQSRGPKAEKDDPRPRQKRAPVERIRLRLSEPEP